VAGNTEAQSELISLRGRYSLEARVVPGMGADLVSFKADGDDLIWSEGGAFNMFPTPCRLANCSYVFEGRTIVQRKNGKDIFIHGLVRDEAFEFKNGGSRIDSWIAIGPGHPAYEGFPFRCTFRVSHELHESGLTVSYEVKNEDDRNIPFGYGIHPFWLIHGDRGDFSVRIPCDHYMELDSKIPTGNIMPVDRTEHDLRKLRSMRDLFLDNVLWKRAPADTAEVVFGAIRKRMTIEASDEFTHMIVYSPEGREFICVENLTSSPNAPNLVAAGRGEAANMQVVSPGRTSRGWVRYTISEV
jgi:aldose 1-epimerase